MNENNETQPGLLVCRVACPDPQKAQEKGFSSILGAISEATGRLFCGLGRHRWSYPPQGGRVCPRCMQRQTLSFTGKWHSY